MTINQTFLSVTSALVLTLAAISNTPAKAESTITCNMTHQHVCLRDNCTSVETSMVLIIDNSSNSLMFCNKYNSEKLDCSKFNVSIVDTPQSVFVNWYYAQLSSARGVVVNKKEKSGIYFDVHADDERTDIIKPLSQLAFGECKL